jgi:hypothetical protein
MLAGVIRRLGRRLAALRPRPEANPAELARLQRLLAATRFTPRASLEPEIYARARRGAAHAPDPPRRGAWRRAWGAGAGAGAVGLLAVAAWLALFGGRLPFGRGADAAGRRLDRCCFDLDGAGRADDGLLIRVRPGGRIATVLVYEDADGSRSFTPGDPVRLAPGAPGPPGAAAAAAAAGPLELGLLTIDRCCWDFDAGGRDDDGIVVLSGPPDRVLAAALYEAAEAGGPHPPARYLRYLLR